MGDQSLGAAGQTRAATPIPSLSAMTPRFNFLLRAFARRYFREIGLDEATANRLRALEARGAVIYVMRYASRLDYFLFNALFRRHGLRLSRFANGIRFYYYRPLWESLRIALTRPRGASQEIELAQARAETRRLTLEGESFFLFLRTARLRTWPRGRRRAVEQGKGERDLLQEAVRAAWNSDATAHVVPLALFWRKGPRARRRFLNLFYGAATRPTDVAKVTSFLTTYRGLSVKVGEPVDLGAFVASRRGEGEQTVARKLRRSILMFLYREEKVVEGPTLQPLHKVQEAVLAAPRVQAAIAARGQENRRSFEGAVQEAEGMVREIAANMNSTVLAVLNAAVGTVMRRLFTSIHPTGLERVAECAKRNPIVLVPSHRSYFDFLILSTMFYTNYLVPPHVAARENMAFGPFGYLWRRVGAFYMRRSFDDPLYKEVFRGYLSYLIREGFTQEFFIEGSRSRTGRTNAPRLGMLTWNVEAFLDSRRRDLFFVPISITYERLVEERAIVGELEGAKKTEESMAALVRARKYLRRRFGSVYVNFGEPISLADALGERRERMAGTENEGEKRAFVEGLGNRIAERINWAAVPSAMSVAACALLGKRRRGMFRAELASRMREIVELLQLQGVNLTDALERDQGDLEKSISSLLPSDLIHLTHDARGDILYFEESGRRALDLYRNSIIHFLAAPSFLARRLLAGPCREDIRKDLAMWLDLFYWEFFTPRAEVLAAHIDAFLDHFEHFGRIERVDGELRATEKGLTYFRFLAELTRGVVEVYYATFAAVHGAQGTLTAKSLLKAAEEQYDRAGILGEVDRREAASPAAFANAIEWLVRCHVLERVIPVADRGSSRDPAYERGDAFEDLAALRDRLATALAAR